MVPPIVRNAGLAVLRGKTQVATESLFACFQTGHIAGMAILESAGFPGFLYAGGWTRRCTQPVPCGAYRTSRSHVDPVSAGSFCRRLGGNGSRRDRPVGVGQGMARRRSGLAIESCGVDTAKLHAAGCLRSILAKWLSRILMKNTVENNLKVWDQQYSWAKNGDEWDGQARFCGQPYEEWKKSLIESLLAPNFSKDSVVLEVAPGHGRWAKEIVEGCKEIILVDLSPSCIEFCRNLFASFNHVRYIVNDGKLLTGVDDNYVDFVWSYDSFVHMDKSTIGSYLSEIFRALKPGGKAVIHHAGRRHALLWLGFLRHQGDLGRRFYALISMGKIRDSDGWRSNISRQLFKELATDKGLVVEAQIQRWGGRLGSGIPRFGDFITILKKN